MTLAGHTPVVEMRLDGAIEGAFRVDVGSGSTVDLHTPFVARHEKIFQTIFLGSRLDLEVLRLKRLSEDLAMVEAKAVLSGFRALPPGVKACADGALHARLLEVLVRREGEWRVAAYHNVDVKPEAAE